MQDSSASDYKNVFLYPVELLPPDLLECCDAGLLNPYMKAYAESDKEKALAAEVLSSLHEQRSQVISSRLASLTGDAVRGLRVLAQRGNWLAMEQEVTQILVDLLWTALLITEEIELKNGEQALRSFLNSYGKADFLEPVFQAKNLDQLCLATLDLVANALPLIHDFDSTIYAQSEDWFWWVYNTRNEPLPKADLAAYEDVAEQITDALAKMPVFAGISVVGSFAETDKHDGFNDLDLYCYCTELPTQEMRQRFFADLGIEQQGSDQAFEYIKLNDVQVHLCLPLIHNQQEALDRLMVDGCEIDCGQFSSPKFAASAYHLTHSRILRDPTGNLAKWTIQSAEYPPALRASIINTWSGVWNRYSNSLAQNEEDDRIHNLIALRYCREAYLRVLAAENSILCDPNSQKWLPHELQVQRSPLLNQLKAASLKSISDVDDHYAQLKTLWSQLRLKST